MILELDFPIELEHELFRAVMQTVVGIRQQHSQSVQEGNARRLEEIAQKHIGTGWTKFKEQDES